MAMDDIRLCWLSGSYWQRHNTLEKIKASFKDAPIFVFDNESPAVDVAAQIGGSGLFSPNRLVILNGLPVLDDKSDKNTKKLIDLFCRVPDGSVVVVNGVPPTERPAVFRAVKTKGKVFEFPEHLDRTEAISWVSARCQEMGKMPTKEACEAFVDRLGVEYGKGVNIDRMYVELLKVVAYVGKMGEITQQDVEAVVTLGYQYVIWNLRDALNRKDFCACMELLNSALVREDNVQTVVVNILGTLVWQYRLLIFLKEMVAAKKSDQEISSAIAKIHKYSKKGRAGMELEKSKDGEPKILYGETTVNVALRGIYGGPATVSLFKRAELFKLTKAAEECIAWTRSGTASNPISDSDLIFAVENFFMTACGVADEEALASVRRPFDG